MINVIICYIIGILFIIDIAFIICKKIKSKKTGKPACIGCSCCNCDFCKKD